MTKFKGIMPALVTPLNSDETVNISVLGELIDAQLKQGADGFYIGGATGEGICLGREERQKLAEAAIGAVGRRKPCIIHIASTNYNEAIELAKHAEKCGADGISAIPPLFFRYNESDVYNYYKTLAEAVSIPLMIYYNPAAGFTITADFAARMFEVDNITAIKWTSPDYYQMMRLKDLTHGEMNIINGPDEMLLMGLNAGADGGIGTTYNVQLETIKLIYESFNKGDIAAARKAQTKADSVIYAMLKFGNIIPTTKVLLEAMGFEVGNASYPMTRYTKEEKIKIVDTVRAAGLEI